MPSDHENAFDATARWARVEEVIRRELESWPAERRRDFAHDLSALVSELLGECPDTDDAMGAIVEEMVGRLATAAEAA
jgi:hypothetical protein